MYSQAGKLLYRETSDGGINYIFLGDKLIAKEGMMPVSTNSRSHYKPFGDSIEAPKDDVGYTGHKFDTDLGWSYMQQRLVDPALGRFMSNDPVGFRDVHSFNRYVYANNNPYKYVDPDGNNAVVAAEIGYGIGTIISHGITAATGASLGVHIYNAVNGESSDSTSDSSSSTTEDKEKPRFIADNDGVVVDTESTPKGSYQQPDGGRTDVLQNDDHGAGRSHTHPPNTNINPNTGETFVNGTGPGQPVTAKEVKNITSGKTTTVQKVGK